MIFAYQVRRDCLKCAVLCYTLVRWEFEPSTRHCMKFKITKDKIMPFNNNATFWNKIKKIYSPCLVSVVHLACFQLSFLGGFQVLSQLSSKAHWGYPGKDTCMQKREPKSKHLLHHYFGSAVPVPSQGSRYVFKAGCQLWNSNRSIPTNSTKSLLIFYQFVGSCRRPCRFFDLRPLAYLEQSAHRFFKGI